MDTATLTNLIETAGVVGLLVLAVVAMFRGWIWPKHMVDRIIEEQRKASDTTAERIAAKIENGMRHAVKDGIKEGMTAGYIEVAKLNNKD